MAMWTKPDWLKNTPKNDSSWEIGQQNEACRAIAFICLCTQLWRCVCEFQVVCLGQSMGLREKYLHATVVVHASAGWTPVVFTGANKWQQVVVAVVVSLVARCCAERLAVQIWWPPRPPCERFSSFSCLWHVWGSTTTTTMETTEGTRAAGAPSASTECAGVKMTSWTVAVKGCCPYRWVCRRPPDSCKFLQLSMGYHLYQTSL